MSIARRIREIRNDVGLTIKEFSAVIQVPEQTISKYEREERAVSSEYLNRLHNKLKVNVNWILTGNGMKYQKDDYIDGELLRAILNLLEIVLEEEGLDLPVEKRSAIMVLAYKHLIATGSNPSKDSIRELIAIAA